ncbi:MAG: hypothetical protein Q3959_06520 [Limosilactobacillus sp.]|uniref:hypothetical protein n=1 Tax=Limosilactobacillus sp. TaxID=2773925 RepID=UPI0027056BA2|nr:hypothetical protein [Limosilactobacillus sp.]
MSLMQNTQDITKTNEQVYLVTLVRQSADLPMYLDNMVYKTTEAGQKFMAGLVSAFEQADYRSTKIGDDKYELDNGLDKITLTGKVQDVFQG